MDPAGRDAGLIHLFRQQEWSVLMSSGGNAPATVYHYTSAKGFAGIVGEAEFRATNFSFLNDPSEIQYGKDLSLQLLTRIHEMLLGGQYLIDHMLTELKAKVISESYVSCFTELSDDLSQWRAYGTSGTDRYCIGFDGARLSSVFNTRPGGRFAKIIYTRDQQEDLINSVVTRAMTFVEKNEIHPENWPDVAKAVADAIAGLLPQFKDPAYKSEAEWRIIRWHDDLEHDSLSFETSRGTLRPYLPAALPLPLIVSVEVMAPNRKDAAVKAADMLLRKAKISCATRHSSIPFAE
jgi:hypothetical protein